MISTIGPLNKVHIYITTYEKPVAGVKHHQPTENNVITNMTEKQCKKSDKTNPKFICSICLNTRSAEGKEKTKDISCSICHKDCDSLLCPDNVKRYNKHCHNLDTHIRTKNKYQEVCSKNIQTSQTDITQGLSLLNEVLNVFQSKKHIDVECCNSKTVVVKDASVSTDTNAIKPKLTIRNLFQHSIDDKTPRNHSNKGMFVLLNSNQPITNSRCSINLCRQKSSSIPQMKLEELKHSLKEKSKSKDAIEEVNRMFATVNRNYTVEGNNRPATRHGPRVLPVVKTNHESVDHEQHIPRSHGSQANHSLNKCHQAPVNAYCMSGGDSIKNLNKHFYRSKMADRYEEPIQVVCFHCKSRGYEVKKEKLVCECCNNQVENKFNCNDADHEVCRYEEHSSVGF